MPKDLAGVVERIESSGAPWGVRSASLDVFVTDGGTHLARSTGLVLCTFNEPEGEQSSHTITDLLTREDLCTKCFPTHLTLAFHLGYVKSSHALTLAWNVLDLSDEVRSYTKRVKAGRCFGSKRIAEIESRVETCSYHLTSRETKRELTQELITFLEDVNAASRSEFMSSVQSPAQRAGALKRARAHLAKHPSIDVREGLERGATYLMSYWIDTSRTFGPRMTYLTKEVILALGTQNEQQQFVKGDSDIMEYLVSVGRRPKAPNFHKDSIAMVPQDPAVEEAALALWEPRSRRSAFTAFPEAVRAAERLT